MLFLLCICSSWQLSAQHSAEATLDTNVAEIGTHIQLKLKASTDLSSAVYFSKLNDSLIKQLEYIGLPTFDTVINQAGDQRTITETITLVIFEAGVYQFAPMPVLVQTGRGQKIDTLYTNALELTITSPEVDTTLAIQDIKPIMHVTFWDVAKEFFQKNYPYILLGILIAALLIFAIYYFYRKHQNKPIFSAPKPKLPPYLIALEQLETLRQQKLWQNNLIKEYYTSLTDILRFYLKEDMGVNATEMTSDEILSAIEDLSFTDHKQQFENIRTILRIADQVKFAKSIPLPDEHDLCFKYVKLFIESTHQTPLNTEDHV